MEHNVKRIGLVNLLVMLVVGVAGFVLARFSHTLSGQAGSLFFGLGFLVLLVSYFQMRLEETERLERLEFDELTRAKGSSSLFNTTDAEVFPARRSREQFERFFVPGFSIVLLLLQAGGAYQNWRWLKNPTITTLNKPMIAMSLFALFALALFLLGKYSAGIARLQKDRLVQPGASYLLLGAYISFVVAASIAAAELGFSRVDLYVARILGVLLALAALENLINLITEIYRPRLKTTAPRLLYDSRLIGLLSQPEGIFTTAAHALDYQFGFKVSETWFYRFLEKALAWLLLLQLAALALSTAFVFIAPGERGLLERWGRPVMAREVLDPGLHFKWPFPIDRVIRVHTDRIQQFTLGASEEGDHAHETKPAEPARTVVWTIPHEKTPFNLLVASRQSSGLTNAAGADQGVPVDLLTISIPVQYQISDVRAWTYNYADADALLEKIATRELVRYFVNVDLLELMSSSRERAAQQLRENIQKHVDGLKPALGVRILFVGLQDIHPPMGKDRIEVAKKFEEVIGAQQEVQTKLREAEGYAASVTNKARAEAQKIVLEAEGYKVRTLADARARAERFAGQLLAYQASPQVFMERAYLEAFARGSTNARKYIIATTNAPGIIEYDLRDTTRFDLGRVSVPQTKKPGEK